MKSFDGHQHQRCSHFTSRLVWSTSAAVEILRQNDESAATAPPPIRLTDEEREQLRLLARRTRDARVLRRAQVLLGLDRGERVIELAERYQVSRATVYNWIRRYQRWGISAEAMKDRPRPGRPGRRGRKGGERSSNPV